MKNRFLIFSAFFFFCGIPLFVFAQAVINTTIPGMGAASSSTPPGQWVSSLYNFALMIGGVLAFGAIVYGGVLYASSMGNPSKQSEGREWIQSALLGLLLLGGAYLVLYTINPALVNLNLPSLQVVNIAGTGLLSMPGSGGAVLPGGSPKLSQADAAAALAAVGITVNNPNTTSLDGMRTDTVLEAARLGNLCKCTILITGGTEPDNHGVAADGVDHVDGYKVDIQAPNMLMQNGITYFVMNDKTDFTYIGPRGGDGAAQYKDNQTGAIWAYEGAKNHWDVTVP